MGNKVRSLNFVLLWKGLVEEDLLIIRRMSETWLTRDMLIALSQLDCPLLAQEKYQIFVQPLYLIRLIKSIRKTC